MRFVKHLYKIYSYTQNDKFFEENTPASAFLISSYDGSFIAGLMELRYIQSLPIERIINYFEGHGFILKKPTAHKLIERASALFENLYKCIRQTVLQDSYICADKTFYRILIPEKNKKGKGVKKGYIWVFIGMRSKMVYLLYDNGVWTEKVILDELKNYKGIVQSNGYAPYRKLERSDYPDIIRIPCIQYIKRKFIDCSEKDSDPKEIVGMLNNLYHEEHKHKIGIDGWTQEHQLDYIRKYAPDILGELSDKLDEIENRRNLLPKSELQAAITYLRNEWNAMVEYTRRKIQGLTSWQMENQLVDYSINRFSFTDNVKSRRRLPSI